MVRGLLDEDFEVIDELSDGESALEAAQALRPHAIVLDVAMPGITGIEVAQRLRAAGCATPIIFLSVHSDEYVVAKALSTKGCGYVAKSDAAEDLAVAIQEVLAGARFLSRSIASRASSSA
jgi:DNA-binding NarL/FixJ family response regulator